LSCLPQFEPLLSDVQVGELLALPKLVDAHLWEGFFTGLEKFDSFAIQTFDEILPAALPDRKGISMSRRSGQNGWVQKRNSSYDARFWDDVEGREKRVCRRVRICPVEGPGALNASERARRLKQILEEYRVNDDAKVRTAQAANCGITFEQQSMDWLREVQSRKRKPVKTRTVKTWESHLRYINPKIGQMSVSEVNNRSMREFVAKMDGDGFSAKTITNYLGVVKSVVASVRNEQGNSTYNVKWNAEYMDVPVVEDQNTPSFTATEIEAILSLAKGQDYVIYALLAGSGLRIGECFALQVEDVRDTVLYVKHGSWDGAITGTKSRAGTREIDICTNLADLLKKHINGRVTGCLFPSETGTPLRKSNLLRRSLHPILNQLRIPERGFHAFRRFRAEHLETALPGSDVLRKLWLGHSLSDISEKYVRNLKHNTLVRTMSAQKAGLGFSIAPNSRPVAPTATKANLLKDWSGREDLNLRPPGPEPGALPG
jgi:integrase